MQKLPGNFFACIGFKTFNRILITPKEKKSWTG